MMRSCRFPPPSRPFPEAPVDPEVSPRPYGLDVWGEGFFDVSPEGHLLVRPRRGEEAIDLARLLVDLRARGHRPPLLLRVGGIVGTRLCDLAHAFAEASRRHGHAAPYRPVYPIKVNQERWIVEEALAAARAPSAPPLGLEAGSKPELLAVLALAPAGGLVVVNGYKDRAFLRTALAGVRLGHEVVVVVEKLSELDLLLDEARAAGVRPRLGVRARLASVAAGKWQNTGGAKSKFGLAAGELLALCARLRAAGAADWLDLLHVHLGSQLANLRDIQAGIHEAARIYVELRRLGFPLRTLDVGGGLGVDYEGTRSRHDCSMNYTLGQYAEVIVHTLAAVCREAGVPAPEIVSESGRALTAHHAILLADVVERETPLDGAPRATEKNDDPALADLEELALRLDALIPEEAYQEAVYWLQDVHGRFLHGALGLEERAAAEARFAAIARRLLAARRPLPTDLASELEERLAERLFCNLSVFQSLPDVWAIDQIFPIVPVEGLREPPAVRAVVRDLTCDSDGRIDRYVTAEGPAPVLPLPAAGTGRVLAFCLVGAYQEILGDVHNLFGATTTLAVEAAAGTAPRVRVLAPRQSAGDVLRRVHCAPEDLLAAYREKVRSRALSAADAEALLEFLRSGLDGSTYLEDAP
jgi:arginine decarboxylase